jgi:hypothetical protein
MIVLNVSNKNKHLRTFSKEKNYLALNTMYQYMEIAKSDSYFKHTQMF